MPQSTDAYGALTVGGLRTPAWDWDFPESLSEQTQGVVLHALHVYSAASTRSGNNTGLLLVRTRAISVAKYPAIQPEIEAAGGTYLAVESDQVTCDGNLITAPAWPAHPAILRAFLKAMGVSGFLC